MSFVSPLLVSALLLICACDGDSPQATDGGATPPDAAIADASSDSQSTFASYFALACPWQSLCPGVGNTGIPECIGTFRLPYLLWQFPNNWRTGLAETMECMRSASSCDDFNQCPTIGSALPPQICPSNTSYCDEVNNTFSFCPRHSEGGLAELTVDLALDEMACRTDQGLYSLPEQACKPNTGRCDGTKSIVCNAEGLEQHRDCTVLHRDYTCIGGGCGLAQPECTELATPVRGDMSGICSSATEATICAAGVSFVLPCPADSMCVDEGDSQVSCKY